jgi:hypothetical protein
VLIDPEIALVYGPWLVQAEYTSSWFYGARPAQNVPTSLGSVFVQGGYVEALCFLTGENRTYNRQQGVFNRVVPNDNLDRRKGTWGAWQVGVRYDGLDLNSGTLRKRQRSDVWLELVFESERTVSVQLRVQLGQQCPPGHFPRDVRIAERFTFCRRRHHQLVWRQDGF